MKENGVKSKLRNLLIFSHSPLPIAEHYWIIASPPVHIGHFEYCFMVILF